MRIADVYLRKGKIFAVGKKGSGGIMVESGAPVIAEASADGMSEALFLALASSVIPYVVPPEEIRQRTALPAAAGVKNEATFFKIATHGTVRERDDRFELLRAFPSGGGWIAKVIQTLPRETSLHEVGAAVLALLQDEGMRMPVRVPK